MSVLNFNLLLKEVGLEPKDVYLVRHKDTRIAQGLLKKRCSSPYELWQSKPEQFEIYQRLQGKDCFQNRDWIAAFVVTPNADTLFAGIYRKLGFDQWPEGLTACPVSDKPVSPENTLYYNLVPDEKLKELEGRLTIEWGAGFRAWIQNADAKESGNKPVLEIRKKVGEPPFPGYRKFLRADVNEIPGLWPSWKDALRNSQGIYLLTCKNTGKQYVGKADGVDGFYGRFLAYATTGHGGNEGMKQHKTSGYEVTILEAIATPTQGELDDLEILWKDKLNTRKYGLNLN